MGSSSLKVYYSIAFLILLTWRKTGHVPREFSCSAHENGLRYRARVIPNQMLSETGETLNISQSLAGNQSASGQEVFGFLVALIARIV